MVSLLKGAIDLIEGRIPTDKLDEREILHLLKRNGFPLLALKHIPSTQLFHQAVEEERKILEIQREEYQRVEERFQKMGIQPVLFKGGGITPSFPYTSGNLDVLVQTEETDEARRILKDLGYVELKNLEEPQKFLFKRFSSGEVRLAFHLHGEIGWGVPFLSNEDVEVIKAPDDPEILLPSPETGCLVIFAHSLYENKKIRLLDLLQFHHWAKGGLDWETMREKTRKRGWEDGFDFCHTHFAILEKYLLLENQIPESNIEMPFKFSFLKSKILYYRKIRKDEERGWKTKMRDSLKTLLWGMELKMKIHSQLPRFIAFSGLDGSGKTTHAKILLKAFQDCGIRTQYVWSRLGSSYLSNLLIKIGKFLFKVFHRMNDSSKDKSEMRKIYLQRGWARSLWLIAVFCELTIQYLFKVRLPLLLGKVVICDRYLLDAFAELAELTDISKIDQSPFGDLLQKFNPRPSLGFYLELPERNSLYQKMGRRLGYLRVNRNKSFLQTSDGILQKALSTYYENFSTIIKGLLYSNPSPLNPKKGKKDELKILVMTNMYPHEEDPTCGIFIQEQVEALRRNGVNLDVLFIKGLKRRSNYLLGIFEFLKRIHQHEYSLIHAHHTYCALIARIQRRLPILLTFHEGEIAEEIGILERIRNYGIWKIPIFSKGLKRWICRRVDGLISVFPDGRTLLGREDALVIPCGIDLHLFKPLKKEEARKMLNLPQDEKILLFPANPRRPEKRYDIAEQAYEIVKREFQNIRMIALRNIPRKKLPLYLNSADLMILTSDYEASPMVIKEAMAVNLPIVSLDVGDVAEMIQETKGCFISKQNPEDFASLVKEVLKNGNSRTKGRERILELDNEKIAKRILEVYQRVAVS